MIPTRQVYYVEVDTSKARFYDLIATFRAAAGQAEVACRYHGLGGVWQAIEMPWRVRAYLCGFMDPWSGRTMLDVLHDLDYGPIDVFYNRRPNLLPRDYVRFYYGGAESIVVLWGLAT